MGHEPRRGTEEGRDVEGDHRGREGDSGGRGDTQAEDRGDRTAGGDDATERSLGGCGARIRDLQVGSHRANLVEVQAETANVLQALDVVACLAVRLEDEASAHRGLGHRGRFLHEAKPHRGHRPGDGSTPGDLARHRHNRAEGRHQVGTQALGDDARAPGADLCFFPTLDVLPLGSVAGAHARAGLLVGRLVVPGGFFHAATLHNATASRGVGTPTALLC